MKEVNRKLNNRNIFDNVTANFENLLHIILQRF